MILNLGGFYSTGFIVGWGISLQLISGITLITYYSNTIDLAFDSLQLVMRDLKYSWLVRYLHVNTVSVVFVSLYMHIIKGLSTSIRTSKSLAWIVGICILFIIILIGFTGYSLVFGQMSYWALTVICNLVTVIPFGNDLLYYIWGDLYISNFCLKRIFMLHFFLSILVVILMVVHLLAVHTTKTNIWLAVDYINAYSVSFSISYILKDIFILLVVILFFDYIVLILPNYLIHPDNYIYAMFYVTPHVIEPEWYLLPYYAILRSVPHKLLGVILLVVSILVFILHLVTASNCLFYDLYYIVKLILFIFTFILLMYIATQAVIYPWSDYTYFIVILYLFVLV
jgi:ubiquinol-cytochrome c reductase cytochrome b subunit